MMHTETHPQSLTTVQLIKELDHNLMGVLPAGTDFRIEDWWDHLTGGSWMNAKSNPAALMYAIRSAVMQIPIDDEVVYGKIGIYGVLVHVSELPDPTDSLDVNCDLHGWQGKGQCPECLEPTIEAST